MTLKGPGSSTQGAIDAFNEVFGRLTAAAEVES